MNVGKLGDIAGHGMLDVIIEAARAEGWHASLSPDLATWQISRDGIAITVQRYGMTSRDAYALLDWCNAYGLTSAIDARMH